MNAATGAAAVGTGAGGSAGESGLQLIAGLGNPGPDYAATRHNVGFWFVERLAEQGRGRFTAEKKLHGELARIDTPRGGCRLFKPAVFMNHSGRAVRAAADYYRVPPAAVLVVHDDIDLDAGVIRLKRGGGHGGHNGLRDVSEKLGDDGYLRMRIGVGHPGRKDAVTSHVLGRPADADAALIDAALQRGLEILPLLYAGEAGTAMTRLNARP